MHSSKEPIRTPTMRLFFFSTVIDCHVSEYKHNTKKLHEVVVGNG